MSTLRARRRPRSLPSDMTASRPMSREYDDNQLRDEQTLVEILPGQGVGSRWVEIDDAQGSAGAEAGFELAGADLVGEDITVPVIPKRADEFSCSNCFLIQHVSRLASARGGQIDLHRLRVVQRGLREVAMSDNTKVSSLDHAVQATHIWVNDVAKEFDTDDREFAYGVLRAWLHTLRDRLTVEASARFAAQLPDLIRGVFYAGWNPNNVPDKYDAEVCALRFAKEAGVALDDVGEAAAATTAAVLHHLPAAHVDKASTGSR